MTRTDIINALIKKYNYKSYLEIGTQNASNYTRIDCQYKVGVDPEPLRMFPGIVKMTSDQFFADKKIGYFDLIFIDGLHHKEQVYRDIINSLNHLQKGGTIVCHDMNPTNQTMQMVPRITKIWTGNGWKAWIKIVYPSTFLRGFVVNTDFGVGVIQKVVEFKKLIIDQVDFSDLNYKDLEENRKRFLNLMSVEEFQNWIK